MSNFDTGLGCWVAWLRSCFAAGRFACRINKEQRGSCAPPPASPSPRVGSTGSFLADHSSLPDPSPQLPSLRGGTSGPSILRTLGSPAPSPMYGADPAGLSTAAAEGMLAFQMKLCPPLPPPSSGGGCVCHRPSCSRQTISVTNMETSPSQVSGEKALGWRGAVPRRAALVRRLRALASAALPPRGGNWWDGLHLFPF